MYRWDFNWAAFRNASLVLGGLAVLAFTAQLIILAASYLMPVQSVPAAKVAVPELLPGTLEPLESFQKKMEARNLFYAPAAPTAAPAKAGIDELSQDLALIGVVTTGEPEAILKDKRLNQTYFLRRHQKIRGLEVKEVRRGSIVLKYQDQEKEIFLD
ncbi:MAG: hypothetical protein HY714_05305 [Candidatus Omnitrophica bacterium]|nr:hypothetical protein [Candidatus Omnitrophota bacterium]